MPSVYLEGTGADQVRERDFVCNVQKWIIKAMLKKKLSDYRDQKYFRYERVIIKL